MKKAFAVILLVVFVLILFGCANKDSHQTTETTTVEETTFEENLTEILSGKRFAREKGGFGGEFTITLHEDGMCTYYVGPLSSIFGRGEWKTDNGKLIIQEDKKEFHFNVIAGNLIFLAEESSSFTYLTVEDGDIFVPYEK